VDYRPHPCIARLFALLHSTPLPAVPHLSPLFAASYKLFSRLLHTTAPASLFFSSTYKLFAVTTEVACNAAAALSLRGCLFASSIFEACHSS
jgi:hypothetical protein